MTEDSYAPALAYGNEAITMPVKQLLDASATETPAAPASTAQRTCPDGSKPIQDWQFVPFIPSIMKAQSPPWEKAAALMERWISGPAQQLKGSQLNGWGTDGKQLDVDSAIITMDWVVQFARAASQFNILSSRAAFTNPEATKLIIRNVRREHDPTKTDLRFGMEDLPKERDRDSIYCNSRTIKTSYISDPLDDLAGALGDFSMYVIPGGFASWSGGGIIIRISQASLYVRDSYDFNGDQPLGYWRRPNEISKLGDYAKSLSHSPVAGDGFCPSDQVYANNELFRKFRGRAKMGRDFIVYSDLMTIQLSEVVNIEVYGDQILYPR